MNFTDIEAIFNRAFRFSFSKKKFFFLFPILMMCGVLIVFCRALSLEANAWVWMSLAFLPIFLCTGVLLAAGVMIVRMYYHDVKGLTFRFQKLLAHSFQLLIGVSYLSLPLMLTYLLLWTLLGVFHLLKGLPGLGDAAAILLSFGPFLLVLGSLLLSFASLLILFLVTPHVALKQTVSLNLAEEILDRMKVSLFANGALLLIGLLPLVLVVGFLTLGAVMTGVSYVTAQAALGVTLQWFFMMVPFCAILTPFVIFFFNFATESHALLRKRQKVARSVQKQAREEEICT